VCISLSAVNGMMTWDIVGVYLDMGYSGSVPGHGI